MRLENYPPPNRNFSYGPSLDGIWYFLVVQLSDISILIFSAY